ncbi:MAG: cyclic nucleotide-binding domain-containing protein [Vulcanimicrobiota bacterium]
MTNFSVTELPRGGQLVSWGDWVAQIGIYPETIKDTMQSPEGVPAIYVIPAHMFDLERGVSAAELEFPVYWNFYLKNRKTVFVCRPHQFRPIWRVLREAVFGPSSLFLERDYLHGDEADGFPDMAREMAWFKADPKRPRQRLQLRDLVEPVLFDQGGCARLGAHRIRVTGPDVFRFEHEQESHEVVFRQSGLSSPPSESIHRFRPPVFGITVLGSGHGFDSASNTSGFIIWFNGRGVMVDPPVNATEWLKENGIDTRMVEDVVLTHCHADHDSGTLQKCLEEGRIRLFTTYTVHESFLRKYKALLGINSAEFENLFDFDPVTIGEPINIAGGEFFFHYNFHPIPTLGFEVEFLGKRFAYSCDTLYHPMTINQLHQEGVLSKSRARRLNEFPANCDLIFHEAGIPPIHTPVEVLGELPTEVREKLYLTHITQASVPEGLKLAPPGVEQTLTFDNLMPPELGLAQRMLDVLNHMDLFNDIEIGRAGEFLRIAQHRSFKAGDAVIRTGDPGDAFFVILSGEAEIVRNAERINVIGRYDYFGEMAIVLNQTRTADVIAHTDLEVLAVMKRDFLRFIRGTRLLNTLRRVAKNRNHGSWPLLAENAFLNRLTTYQKTQLVALMENRTFDADKVVLGEDKPGVVYLLDEGRLRVTEPDGRQTVARRGALIGRMGKSGKVFPCKAVTECQSCAYLLPPDRFLSFFMANPGTYVRYLAQVRARGLSVLT